MDQLAAGNARAGKTPAPSRPLSAVALTPIQHSAELIPETPIVFDRSLAHLKLIETGYWTASSRPTMLSTLNRAEFFDLGLRGGSGDERVLVELGPGRKVIAVLLARLFPASCSTTLEPEQTLRRRIIAAGRSGIVRRSRWTRRLNGDFSDSWLRGMPTAAHLNFLDGQAKGGLR